MPEDANRNSKSPSRVTGSEPGGIAYLMRCNDKHVKDALGHLRSVKLGLMGQTRALAVMAAQRKLEEWMCLDNE